MPSPPSSPRSQEPRPRGSKMSSTSSPWPCPRCQLRLSSLSSSMRACCSLRSSTSSTSPPSSTRRGPPLWRMRPSTSTWPRGSWISSSSTPCRRRAAGSSRLLGSSPSSLRSASSSCSCVSALPRCRRPSTPPSSTLSPSSSTRRCWRERRRASSSVNAGVAVSTPSTTSPDACHRDLSPWNKPSPASSLSSTVRLPDLPRWRPCRLPS
mmetsp:Transcript_6927/g.19683  ORF Transcript_6927/g.19683 Transcript_6927/m.19683 type:complete len:209 (-) Transcript_6927:364-990(-)